MIHNLNIIWSYPMIALGVALYLVAGVAMGAVTYVRFKLGKIHCPPSEVDINVILSILAWPLALVVALTQGVGWLLFKCAEWLGKRIVKIRRSKSDV